MKIIRTPIKWESSTSGSSSDWLHSESAEITVDELTMGVESRTGKVAFTQSGSVESKEKEVTVAQNRVTFYYTIKTDYRPSAEFEIGGERAYSKGDGLAWVALSGESAAESVTATPVTDIAELKVSPSVVVFPYTGGLSGGTFTWRNWNPTAATVTVTVPRKTMSGETPDAPAPVINSVPANIDTVNSASVLSGVDWISANTSGDISAKTNDSTSVRTATITYSYGTKTARVDVTQYGKSEPTTVQYFGVKTMSTFANEESVTFKINGGENIERVFNRDSGGFYIAYITASSNSNVTVSCNISDYWIEANPPELEFPYSGATKGVIVNATKEYLSVDTALTGYDSLTLNGLYQIDSIAEKCGYSVIVGGEGFCFDSIQGDTTLITASENETEASREGRATFSIAEAPDKETTVSLTQKNTPLFSFKSSVTGSPSGGTVTIYDTNGLIQPEKIVTTLTYTQDGGVYSVDWSGHVKSSKVTYVVNGFERSGTISASTSSVTFGSIEMKKNSNGHYYISGAEAEVTVSALGVSYQYQCKIDGKPSSYTTSGVITANSEVVLSATATTTNEFYTSADYSGTDRNNWEYVVNSGDSWAESATTVDVKCLALRQPKKKKVLKLTYHLGNGDDGFNIYTAQTTFDVPVSADSGINFDNFALSSSTAFWDAYHKNHGNVPTGSNSAYTFAFIPPSRKSFSNVSNKTTADTNHADLGYKTGTTSGWALFYPSTSGDVDGNLRFQDYAAKVYSLSYAEAILSQQGAGLNDTWYLGPLLYKVGSDAYHEVDGFKFESGSNISLISTNAKEGGGCASLSSNYYNYPSECPFPCSQTISAATQYFMFINGGQQTASSSTSGAMSGDGVWYFSGKGQGGLNHKTTELRFFNRTKLMRERNFNYQYTTGDTNCSEKLYDTPNAMAHVASGTIKTNLLGSVQIKMIYYGKYNSTPDVPSTSTTLQVPASEYVVSPKTPGDTSSVVYDAETGYYIIYDINNVVVLKNMGSNYVVVDASELMQTSGEIIDPVDP